MPSASKPLPEPMLTQTYVAIWCHQTTMTNKSSSHTQFITKAFNLVYVYESKNKLEFVNP